MSAPREARAPDDLVGSDDVASVEVGPDDVADAEVEPDETAPAVAELDPETRARRDAALREVRRFGDPVLRTRAVAVERFDERLASEVQRMGLVMADALGIGLAATQVGVLHRVLVYRVQAESPIAALVNPRIEWSGDDLETMEEGCLSLPTMHVEVERPLYVRVSAQEITGEQLSIEASGLEARVIQHEIDHLDGVLILDRISRERRKEAMREMREAHRASAAA